MFGSELQSCLVFLSAVLLPALSAPQTTVFVKFVSPPHGYSHGLQVHTRGGMAVAQEERLYPPFRGSLFSSSVGSSSNYYYPKPNRPFIEETRTPKIHRPSPQSLWPMGVFYPPVAGFNPYHQQSDEVYDPHLITGPTAARYVAMILSRGELFFHLIPHERLVLSNQQERLENNLPPHILGSIRPNHPFYLH